MGMEDYALCIIKPRQLYAATDLDIAPVWDGFWEHTPTLVQRKICETNEALLQLLPYTTLMREDSVLMYTRGGGGTENRLHSKLSIGIGGHVDLGLEPGAPLQRLLQLEAARECLEETGLNLAPAEFNFGQYIYDPLTTVGRVHLGLWATASIDEDAKLVLEKGALEDGVWVPVKQLFAKDIYRRLEPWSRIVAHHLLIG